MTAASAGSLAEVAVKLARGGFGAHLLDLGSIQVIESESFVSAAAYNGSSSSPVRSRFGVAKSPSS